jgi:hypothetical protein
LAQGATKPPPRPLGVVRPLLRPNPKKKTLGVWPKGQPNHPLGHWGWFDCSQTTGLGVAEPPLGQTGWPATTYRVVRPPQQFFFSFLDFLKNKIFDDGILRIKRPKGVNCHNLKVWKGKVSHFKFWRQKCKSVDTSGE